MNEQMNKWMNKWMDAENRSNSGISMSNINVATQTLTHDTGEWMNERMNEWMNKRMNE